MLVTHESLLTILSALLQDNNKSFKEVMEEISKCISCMNIHIALTCIRLFLCIPIILLKPSWKKVPGKPKKYNLLEWHAVASDKQISVNDKIFCVWNGDSMCIPALPTAVTELNTNISYVEENIDEALQLLQETKAMVPKSKLKEGILEVEKQMKLSGDLISTFKMATGGATLVPKCHL